MFAGNTHDSKTYQEIIRKMEEKYGKANRIWCSDFGMTSKENIEFLKQDGRKFIIGTVDLQADEHILGVKITGKNEKSTNFKFGMDKFEFRAVE